MVSKSLEIKLKPDGKQWWPVYGIHKMFRDKEEGKPSIIETSKYWSEYHGITSTLAVFGLGYGLYKLAKMLF